MESLQTLKSELTRTVDWVIEKNGKGLGWDNVFNGCDGKRHPYSEITTSAKTLAIEVLDSYSDDGIKRLEGLKAAIECKLGTKIHEDWVYRAFALYCEPDDNGHIVTVELLERLWKMRVEGFFETPEHA